VAEAVAARAALVAQVQQPLHAAGVAGAACLDALADPHLFLRPELVEAAARARLGRQFLLTILAQLRAEDRDPILIEVETNNAPANALYRAVGFDPVRTFEYYRMNVRP
jgi:GNAT superfamily N-acetyltransferase